MKHLGISPKQMGPVRKKGGKPPLKDVLREKQYYFV
jgi:hypothetical protein